MSSRPSRRRTPRRVARSHRLAILPRDEAGTRQQANPATLEGIEPPEPRRGMVGPFSRRQLVILAVAVAVAAVAVKLLTTPLAAPGTAVPTPGASFVAFAPAQVGLRPGDRAPELAGVVNGKLVQLTSLDGRPLRLSTFAGHPVWVNFFASWCPPCQAEMPTLEEEYEAHRAEGLVVIGVSVQESSVRDVQRYATTYGLQYPIGFDGTSAVYQAYHVYGLPTQVFIDRNGIVRRVWNGPLTRAQAEQMLAPLLAAGPGSGGNSRSAGGSGAPLHSSPAGSPGPS